MSNPSKQPITATDGIDTRAKLDNRLAQESVGKGDNTVHGIPPFTVPRADGTLEASKDIYVSVPQTATARMRRRQGDVAQTDQDGDGNFTNRQGYRDGGGDDSLRSGKGGDSSSKHDPSGLTATLKSGTVTRRSLLQRLRKAVFPTLVGAIVGWYYDAVGVLVFRNDPRIKG
ncbi:hypothetical protein BGX27_005394 [Mortierella sp. AM989]|nr:hypothetical protein BGX27_005394 [Mortierella sp. AM989]